MSGRGTADRAGAARATLLVIASAACFSTIAILVTLALRAGAPLLTVLAGRFVFAAAALLPVAGVASLGMTPAGSRLALVALAGPLQAILVFCGMLSLRWLPAATLVILFYTYPAWLALIGAWRGTERITTVPAVALGISLTGVVVMIGAPGPGSTHPAGATLALTSALLFAVYVAAIDRVQTRLAPTVTAFWVSLGAGSAFLIAAAVSRRLVLTVAPAVWGYMIALGVLSTALGFALFFSGLRTLGPVRTAIVSTSEPFWAALLGWLLLAQPITAATAGGGLLIAAAVVILTRNKEQLATP
ncbi:MAG: DMT family transporter [Gemmatimonadaceae bacterium]